MIAAHDLREMLDYDPGTGAFSWRVSRRSVSRGARTGTINGRGYVVIKLCGRMYLAHRLAWLHAYGEWPDSILDHANGNKADNRIANLRLATYTQNNANMRRPRRNLSGFKGVNWDKQRRKWKAQIHVHGRQKYLGLFDKAEDAAEAYRSAAVDNFGKFARLA